MLGAQGLWAGRDLYRATPAITRGLGFYGLIEGRLLRHKRGCGWYNPDPHRDKWFSTSEKVIFALGYRFEKFIHCFLFSPAAIM
jgi:hypothetical protein